ncbi:MAG: hypothetical protein WDN23_00860 [Edaphobacter sp.]
MSTWPPPPNLDSIRTLVREADPEGYIAEGSAPDEYEIEEDAIFAFIAKLSTEQLTETNLMPIIEQVWRNSFAYDDEALSRSRPALCQIAHRISLFFGPGAMPQVRSNSGA